ncbi:MAG: glycerol-3-phosphate acyltransferase [Synechococcales cyanobacterium C42_A2020_086]|jgi:pyruvate,water dikinase|nr:glycerol-3-phosphate acyltransferase [Synechococcales cyanobacterium C42_A2020_086]
MTLTQVLGVLLIFVFCPLLGGLPLIRWITYVGSGRRLDQMGTGNVSVSAAFYHGGRWIGLLAVLSEALKGIAAVLLARYCFPVGSAWEIVALMALVMGRYWFAKGAGTTNVVWGYVVHDPITAGLVFLIGMLGFTLLRERRTGKLGVLVLLVLITALRYPQSGERIMATMALALLMAWIYQKIPDDLDLPVDGSQQDSRTMFRFFQGNRALRSLEQPLDPQQVGAKAATLAQLYRWGYPIPPGWVLPPGDDPAPLLETLDPSPEAPLVVRSSAIGEDGATASAAGQYESLLDITSRPALEQAILRCQASYSLPHAVRYRQDRGLGESGMAVLVQRQVQGVFSGVAFSRDPIARQGDAVVVEALPGMASPVVSGRVTPERYCVWITEALDWSSDWRLPESVELPLDGNGDVPTRLIQQVAYLARHLEARFHGIPQDIEWSYDGQQLWLLQARPITTLLPIWTRKIAAEVIPGYIHPLTWSINRPLTCGVWGDLFTLVLGERARGLDFNQTATLHRSAAYFNASLLGDLFRRMGLPPESLEFLTRGAKFSKPPLSATLRNIPGLWRLAQRELWLETDFARDQEQVFQPVLATLSQQSLADLTPEELLSRIHRILDRLQRATYYSILAPLSAALRAAILRVDQSTLDNSALPEVAAVRALQQLANELRPSLPSLDAIPPEPAWAMLTTNLEGKVILPRFQQFLDDYGYLSEVGTDIAVPTWKEDPHPVQDLLIQFLVQPPTPPTSTPAVSTWKQRQAQRRLTLKGRVTEVYSKLLAELRWSVVALEQRWLQAGILTQPGDIFFLTFAEIQQQIADPDAIRPTLAPLIAQRRDQLDQDRQITPPLLVYGNAPLTTTLSSVMPNGANNLRGIPASPGQAEGRVLILRQLRAVPDLDRQTILVVPYTDSGWAPLLARAGGLIAEVGGQLSHGAIVAREYGIPAVMDLHHASDYLRDGQRVRIDGATGLVEVLENGDHS